MNRFIDEEYHFYGDFEFCITDDDIKKLKQGKILYSDVDEEYTIILKYYEVGKNKALEQETCEDAIHRDRTVQDFVEKCRECGREKVLDKIRAEIDSAKMPKNRMSFFRDGIDCALQIIDKYKE